MIPSDHDPPIAMRPPDSVLYAAAVVVVIGFLILAGWFVDELAHLAAR